MQIPANPTGNHKKILLDTDDPEDSRYRCVEILPGGLDCCRAVRDTLGTRFLSAQVPSLPLDGCDAKDCQCSYELLPDRRTNSRRVSDALGDNTSYFFESHNRHRTSTGRRQKD